MEKARAGMKKRKVILKVRAPGAQSVHLAGEFNAWDPGTHPMKKHEDGFWKLGLRLNPGKYEYKLIVDGRWWEDAGKPGTTRNPFGTWNRVLVVPEKRMPKRKPAPHPL